MAANMSLKSLGEFRIEESQLCINASGETFWILSIICLLQLLHHRRLHRLHIRKPEKLPGFERRAVDFNVNLHGCSQR